MQFIMQLTPVVLLVATLFTMFYLSFAFVPRIYKTWKQRRWDKWCKKSKYVLSTPAPADYWKDFFHTIDVDYSCGAAFCDDPACNTHGPKNADGDLRYWENCEFEDSPEASQLNK